MIGKLRKHFLFIVCMGAVLLTGVIDFKTGANVSMMLVYAVPVFIAAWYCGKIEGIVVAMVAAICWLLINFIHSVPGASMSVLSWNAGTRMGVLALIAYTVSLQAQLKRSLALEQQRANTDRLTGLLNKGSFRDRVEEEMTRAIRYQHPLTLAFIDLDNFKQVNDTFGHTRGDLLLQRVSQAIREATRKTDIAGRIGGDEFAVCYPETDDAEAKQAVKKMIQSLEVATSQSGWQLTASIGVITCTRICENYDVLLGKADTLMYLAKEKGKNIAEFMTL